MITCEHNGEIWFMFAMSIYFLEISSVKLLIALIKSLSCISTKPRRAQMIQVEEQVCHISIITNLTYIVNISPDSPKSS